MPMLLHESAAFSTVTRSDNDPPSSDGDTGTIDVEGKVVIKNATGNVLLADAEALVNTVNCVGVMGKGIALQFKQAWPAMAEEYERLCRRGEMKPGQVQVWETRTLHGPKYIINFPTKRDWFKKSQYADIASGLESLVNEIRERQIGSVAVPALGCGAGGLTWAKVRPMIEDAFAELPGVEVMLYGPGKEPSSEGRVVRTKRPALTRARALFIAAIDRYSALAYQVTQLEIQKLAYFLQEAGEPLRLKTQKGLYGPYADNLNKVLETLEGHYIRGYDGNRKPDKEIVLTDSAASEAAEFLSRQPDARARLERVGELIEGFETPYGMELLSSVHYVAAHESPSANSADEAVAMVHAWNNRKRDLLASDHIRVAWDHLRSTGWTRSS
jgi:O-acetyl-ADP-ribose deacetylase (regulator of RNase III)